MSSRSLCLFRKRQTTGRVLKTLFTSPPSFTFSKEVGELCPQPRYRISTGSWTSEGTHLFLPLHVHLLRWVGTSGRLTKSFSREEEVREKRVDSLLLVTFIPALHVSQEYTPHWKTSRVVRVNTYSRDFRIWSSQETDHSPFDLG